MVIPLFELLSWLLIWSDTWVLFIRRISVLNCPAFSSTAVMFNGPAGAGAAAGCAMVLVLDWRRNRMLMAKM
ncbi:hypothetical protein AXF42_Ash003575 [Apostasia shenzhenica]|uniref:Uncharacterized protein n=1 Tax=Apostasia shenzhenica TaxID=1088818 RepID=A0A2I0BGJ0_9ASPA|nr:hypothetical protein AXF42_Ash003575 [Apostasia shenzhenica]